MFTTLAHRNHVYVEARNDMLARYEAGQADKRGFIGEAGFMNTDYALFMSDTGMKKTNLGLTRRKHNMKFFVAAGTSRSNEGSRELQEAMKERADERITVMFANNVTTPGNYMPLTSWLMVHRIAHTIQSNFSLRYLEEGLHYGVYDMLKSMGLIRKQPRMNMDWGPQGELAQFYNLAMTMRSARMGLIGNSLDYLGELLAQYQYGGVKLQRSSEWAPRIASFDASNVISKSNASATTYWLKDFGSHTKQFDNFDDRIQEVEEFINITIGKIFDEFMGKTLKF